MAKGIKIGVGGIKTSKKIWVGVGGVARKVKKIFAGIGGVVKLLLSSEIKKYPNSIPGLLYDVGSPGGGTAGGKALIAGGWNGSASSNSVAAYDEQLVRTWADPLVTARNSMGSGTIGNFACFMTGQTGNPGADNGLSNVCEAYNQDLVRVSMNNIESKKNPDCASTDDYLFMGGSNVSSSSIFHGSVRTINKSLVAIRSFGGESYQAYRGSLLGRAGDYMMIVTRYFAGEGVNDLAYNIDKSLITTRIPFPEVMKPNRWKYKVGSTGKKAVIAGGFYDSNLTKNVFAFDSNLVYTTAADLQDPIDSHGMTIEADGNAVFAGGRDATNYPMTSAVQVYDDSLTRKLAEPLTRPKYGCAITKTGNYFVIGGGMAKWTSSTSETNEVEAYEF